MSRRVIIAIGISLPVALIALIEVAGYLAALANPEKSNPARLLLVLAAAMALIVVWAVVIFLERQHKLRDARTPFDVAAAMAIAEAKKRPPAGKCGKCGRLQISEVSPKCLYCGAPFSAAPPPA